METITFDHYHFFVLLGVLQCFVLAGLLIGFKKFRKKADIALGVALITTGFAGIGHVFFHTGITEVYPICLLYTSPSPGDATLSRMPSSA